jgi:hypothetical protein
MSAAHVALKIIHNLKSRMMIFACILTYMLVPLKERHHKYQDH